MDPAAYQIIAIAMRYVFVLLIGAIVLQVVFGILSQYKSEKQARQVQNQTNYGYLEVVFPKRMQGRRFLLCCEMDIGSSKYCDVRIKHAGLAKFHAAIFEQKGALFLSPKSRRKTYINDMQVKEDHLLVNGDKIGLGDSILYVYMLAPQQEEEIPDETI